MKIEKTTRIKFDPVDHTYRLDGGRLLTPVSSVLNSLEPPFDAEGKSYGVARREILAKHGLLEMPAQDTDAFNIMDLEIKDLAQELRDRWEATGQESIDFGNWVDKAVEDSINGFPVPIELQEVVSAINQEHAHYYKEFAQFMVFDEEYGICGTTDRTSLRGSRSNVVDITDIKTGLNKGMTYDGFKIKDGIGKYYNKFYLEPLSHIEVSSYARYTLQLSSYAFLLQRMFPEVKIGRLKVCFVDRVKINHGTYEYIHRNIPIMYMRHEVETLFKRIKSSTEMLNGLDTTAEKKVTPGMEIPDY